MDQLPMVVRTADCCSIAALRSAEFRHICHGSAECANDIVAVHGERNAGSPSTNGYQCAGESFIGGNGPRVG